MQFSFEQEIVFNKYQEGKNIFITGPGGTGKTALIRHIQKDAYNKCLDVQVCALTGCAAVLLECKAKTVHSWSGIGLGNGSIEYNINKLLKNRFAKSTWKGTDLLIIDEVSMMSKKLFEMLNAIGKALRRNNKPFGGIQVIFSGDFYQLPPVGNKDEPDTSKFCFESMLWNETFDINDHVILSKIFRQNDAIYQRILNQIREGRIKRGSNELLLTHVNKILPKNIPIKPTKLYPTRNKVDYINSSEMKKLQGIEYEYNLKYIYDIEMSQNEKNLRLNYTNEQIHMELMYLQSNLRCDKIIKLKIGAQVMCIVNYPLANGDILCNGAQGVIIDITKEGLPLVNFNNKYQMTMNYHTWSSEVIPGIGVSQIPLILAWALTIHKAQGATLEIAEIDAGTGIFECGQTYVALSRVKSLEGLYLSSFDVSRIRINTKVQEFYETLEEQQQQQKEQQQKEQQQKEQQQKEQQQNTNQNTNTKVEEKKLEQKLEEEKEFEEEKELEEEFEEEYYDIPLVEAVMIYSDTDTDAIEVKVEKIF
jgi:ATP-dependent DNA helicase PIF1